MPRNGSALIKKLFEVINCSRELLKKQGGLNFRGGQTEGAIILKWNNGAQWFSIDKKTLR